MKPESELNQHELAAITEEISRHSSAEYDPMSWELYQKLVIKAPHLLTDEEADKFAHLYLKHIAGVDLPAGINAWLNAQGWRDKVGQRLNAMDNNGPAPEDGISFWQEVSLAIPGLLKEEELAYLKETDSKGWGQSFSLFCRIGFGARSLLAQEALNSIQAWK